jgi:hypothetical protein
MRRGHPIKRAVCAIASVCVVIAVDAGTTVCRAQEPQHVTVPHRLMCGSQRNLREALRAVDNKDNAALSILSADCHYSADGVLALVLQDNISAIKVRLFGASGRVVEYWTLPDTVKPVDKR